MVLKTESSLMLANNNGLRKTLNKEHLHVNVDDYFGKQMEMCYLIFVIALLCLLRRVYKSAAFLSVGWQR